MGRLMKIEAAYTSTLFPGEAANLGVSFKPVDVGLPRTCPRQGQVTRSRMASPRDDFTNTIAATKSNKHPEQEVRT